MLKSLLDPMPRKLRGAGHVQHIYCDSVAQKRSVIRAGGVIDVRRAADARGFIYALSARLVWLTPLACIARQLHRLPRIWGEVLFTEQPLQNPLTRFVVTRRVAR